MSNSNSNNSNSNKSTAGGVTFCGLLTIAFIVLKLTGIITWSWVWVLAPLWIPAIIVITTIITFIVLIIRFNGEVNNDR